MTEPSDYVTISDNKKIKCNLSPKKRRERRQKKICEKTIANKFTNVMKTINSYIQMLDKTQTVLTFKKSHLSLYFFN